MIEIVIFYQYSFVDQNGNHNLQVSGLKRKTDLYEMQAWSNMASRSDKSGK